MPAPMMKGSGDWRCTLPHKVSRTPQGVGQLGNLGAVGVVIGIVEVILDKAAVRVLHRCADDLRKNEFIGYGVPESCRRDLKFEFVRKCPVKDRVAFVVHNEQVDGACPPGSVRIPEGDPHFLYYRRRDKISASVKRLQEVRRSFDKGLQGSPVHHIAGRNVRGIIGSDDFVNQVRFVEFKTNERDKRPEIG